MILWAALVVAAFAVCFGAGYGFHAWREPRRRRGDLAGPFTGGRR